MIYAHAVTPAFLAGGLPVLTGQWSSFLIRFEKWLDRLDADEGPSLHFLHSLLPDIPYTTLPTTHRLFRHGPTAGHVTRDQRDELSAEQWADVEARYLFLWQVKLVDRVIGRVVARLKSLNTYDNSLLIVTADHGTRLAPGMSRRQPFAANCIDIAAVPLFVKRPDQSAARRIERPLHSTEVQKQLVPRRIRSFSEYIDLPETLDLRTGLNGGRLTNSPR